MTKKKIRPLTEEEMADIDHSEWLYRDLNQGLQAADQELAERVERIRDYLLDVLGRISDTWHYDTVEGMKHVRSLAQSAYHYRMSLQIAYADIRGDEVDDEARKRWELPQESEWFQAILKEALEATEEASNQPAEGESVH